MKVTMTEAICKEGMALLEDKARTSWPRTPILTTIWIN